MIRGWIDQLISKRCICFDDKTKKIAFYLGIAFVSVVILMSLLAMTYAGTIHPYNLLRYDNFSFAYAGAPNYVTLYSDNLSVGLNSINGSTAELLIKGDAKMTLSPEGEVMLKYKNGNTSFPAQTISGKNYRVYITTCGEADYFHDMNFSFENRDLPGKDAKVRYNNWIKLVKINNNKYLLQSSDFDPGAKQFFVKNSSKCTHNISIYGNDLVINGEGMGNVNHVDYTGNLQIDIDDNANLNMKIPIAAMTPAGFYKLWLNCTDGYLDVTHNEYKCSSADTIDITPIDAYVGKDKLPEKYSSHLTLLNGDIIAYGRARSLEFRERDFSCPLYVIIKEGHLAILIGLLSSFLTLMIGRLIRQIKNK